MAPLEVDESYDPHEFREVVKPLRTWECFLHILKGVVGTGVLVLSRGFYHAGLIPPFIVGLLPALISIWTIHILIKMQYRMARINKVPYLTAGETMSAAFQIGPPLFQKFSYMGEVLTDVFLVLFHLGGIVSYIAFTADSIVMVFDRPAWENRLWQGIVTVPAVLLNNIRYLKHLTPISFVATMVTAYSFCLLIYYIARPEEGIVLGSDITYFGQIQNVPIFTGQLLFSVHSIGLVLYTEYNMKEPKKFLNPLGPYNLAMIVVFSSNYFIGVFGYLKYGSEIKNSITLNLPREELLALTVTAAFGVYIFLTIPLCFFPAKQIIWAKYLKKRFTKHFILLEITIATVTTLFCLACSLLLPKVNLIISLTGGVCIGMVAIFFPSLMEYLYLWAINDGRFVARMMLDILFMICGLLCAIVCTYSTIYIFLTED